MYHVPLALQCIYVRSNEGAENGDGKEGREWRLLGLLYAYDLVLCDESEDDVRAGKSKAMVLNGEEGLDSEVSVNGVRLC